MEVINCPNVIKPKVVKRESRRFGLPAIGTTGQNTAITSILIHCIPELPPQICGDKPALHRADLDWRTSYHYLIPKEGETIYQDVEDRDTAYGLSPKVALGTSVVTYECALFPSFTITPGQPLDRNIIHIAVERPNRRTAIVTNPVATEGDCECGGSELEKQFGIAQTKSLVKLIAWLSDQYSVPLNAAHVNWRHNIDMCEKDECGCPPCTTELYCRVSNYCASIALPNNPGVKEGDLVWVYGHDKYGEQRRERVSDLLTRWGVAFTPVP